MSGAPSGKLEEGEGKGGRIRTKKEMGERPDFIFERKASQKASLTCVSQEAYFLMGSPFSHR